jgi:Tfp pilus assembly protein PilF
VAVSVGSTMAAPQHPGSNPVARSIHDEIVIIRQLVAAARIDEAEQHCAAIEGLAPTNPDVWIVAAEVASLSQKLTQARDNLRRAAACEPSNAALLLRIGQHLLKLGLHAEALGVAHQAERIITEDPSLLDGLGSLLTHAGDPRQGLLYVEAAVQRAPANVGYRYNLAMAQRMNGSLEAAESNLDTVISSRPNDGEAYHARSGLRAQSRERNHVTELKGALARQLGRRAGIGIEFALAKELEDLSDYESSFEHLYAACRRFRALLQYDVLDDIAVLDSLRETHSKARLATLETGYDNNEPIFILGLPRTGTTLVEQILGSHSQVFAAGELNAFPAVAIRAVTVAASGRVNKREFVGRSLDVDFASLGRAYIDATRPLTGQCSRFTDKLPLNYLYAGLIHVALPKARFVLIRRHPVDSCYAMYKTLFAAAYPFSYDLLDLARYYVAWDRLMRHWEEIIGKAWLSVSYEDLVANQDPVSRHIVEHCGLQWEARCLTFHKNPQPVATASAVQVRQPLYSSSVGKWRAYARQLQPLADHLEGHGIACG